MGLSQSKQLLPFAMLRPSQALIPVDDSGDLLEDPGAVCSFWTELDEIYQQFRGQGRSTPKTLLDQLDFNGSLVSQLPASEDSGVPLIWRHHAGLSGSRRNDSRQLALPLGCGKP